MTRGSAAEASAAPLLLLVLLLASALLAPRPAAAQCVQIGSDVSCTGIDSDGFPNSPDDRPPTEDDLDITVESGGVVQNFIGAAGATNSIAVLENNTIVVEQNGGVGASGGAAAIFGRDSAGTDRNTVTNSGTISAAGAGARAIDLGSLADVVNTATGRITAAGNLGAGTATGIDVGANSVVSNDGVVEVLGGAATGIAATASGTTVQSSGSVIVRGPSGVGIDARTLDHSGSTRVEGNDGIGLRSQGAATNDGSVDVQGDRATGIVGTGTAQITNTATVTVSGDDVTGMRAGARGRATNLGDVTVTGTGAAGLSSEGTSFGTTRVVNDGSVTASGAGAAAIVLERQGDLDNSGLLNAVGADGVGVRIDGPAGNATNTGTIRGGSGTGVGVLFQGGAGEVRTFLNDPGGRVEAQSGAAIRGGDGQDRVRNRGDVVGSVSLGSGDDLFEWGTGSSVSGALSGGDGSDALRLGQSDTGTPADDSFDLGSASGFETLTVGNAGDPGSWTLTGSGSYPDGIVLLDGELRIDPAATVQDELRVRGGLLGLDDGISLPAGVDATAGRTRIEDGASVAADFDADGGAALEVAGNGALQGDVSLQDAVLEVPFDSSAASGRLDVSGKLDLGAASELELQQSDAGTVSGEPTLRVATAGTRSGEFGEVRVTGSSDPGLRALPSYGSGAGTDFVDVLLTSRYAPFGSNKNARRLGAHLDQAENDGPSADFQAFLDSLDALPNAGLSDALDSLHGAVYDAHTSTALATATRYAEMLARRPLRCERMVSPYRRNRPSLPPCSETGLSVWGEAFGLLRDRDGGGSFDDWSSAGGGLALGADRRVAKSWTISGLVGTSRSGLDLDDDGDGSYTSLEAAIGVGWAHERGSYARAAFAYGHGWHTTHRRIRYPGFSRLARSDHESDRLTLFAEAGHSFRFMPFEIEPLASVEYTWLEEESLDESNAGVVRLDLDSRTQNQVATNAGFRAGMTLVKYAWAGALLEWADGVWRPEIRASWRQVWTDYDRDFDARLRGAPAGSSTFQASAEDAQYGGRVGGSVSFQPYGSRNTIEVGYEAFVGDGTTSHVARAMLRVPF